MKNLYILSILLIAACCTSTTTTEQPPSKLKALILDGQNNHYIWPKTTQMMKSYLEETGLFEVDIQRMDSIWLGYKYNPNRPVALGGYLEQYPLAGTENNGVSEKPILSSDFDMDFSSYDLIVSNLGAEAALWPRQTQESFQQFVAAGGGLVIVHAANNAWGQWDAYNELIGLGAWGDRDSTTGPYAYYNDAGELELDAAAGICGSHGMEHEYVVTTREPSHPIMAGLPASWLHAQDELYDRMRGPFKNATILATAYSDVEKNKQPWPPALAGTGRHVPVAMVIEYGKGRVFHTPLGHFDYSQECVGFITLFQRGAEWATTGSVRQSLPEDFPSETQLASRTWQE